MRFLHDRDEELELSLDDVFLLPGYFDGGSRLDVNLSPTDFLGGSHPVVTANMNAVSGRRMAETVARLGGLSVLPQDMSLETVRRIVNHIKAADTRFDTPLIVSPHNTLRDVSGLIRKRAHDMVLVVDDERQLLGVITGTDLLKQDQYTRADRLMTTDPVTITPSMSNKDAFLLMHEQRVRAVPVVDSDHRVVGILTKDDALRQELFQPSLDGNGRLMVAAALGISADAADQAKRLLDMGVDVLVLDTAHGHQRRMLQAIEAVRAAVAPSVRLVAGNVCTPEGTRHLINAGADVVKVNVGPGAMCTTRMQTGVGRPSLSAVKVCADQARDMDKCVWADGGVRYPRDVALYLAAGASRVMVGTWLAGTYESPGDLHTDTEGALYKENYGMASGRAVQDRNGGLDAFEQARKGFFREGISTSRIYLQEGRESVGAILVEIITGLRSALTYVGVDNLDDFYDDAFCGVQTPSGFHEGTPHGRVRR